MKEGDSVIYKGKETFIGQIGKNNKVMVKNPDWKIVDAGEWIGNNDNEDNDDDLYIPYWITVNISKLTEIK